MKTFRVYHSKPNYFADTITYHLRSEGGLESIKHHWNNGAYYLVASVEAYTLDEAYRFTNHNHDGCVWWRNSGVKLHGTWNTPRSTSVGDIIEVKPDSFGEKSKFYVVAGVGFDEIDLGNVPTEARNKDDHSRHF